MSQKRILDFFGGSSVPKVSRLAEEDTHVGDETANGIAIAEEDGDNGPLPVPLENGPAVALPAAATNNGSSRQLLTTGKKPFQPFKHSFPSRRFGNETCSRSFSPAWFNKWTWLHYVPETDRALCFTCVGAIEKKLTSPENFRAENPFVSDGFGNWRKATTKFTEHERSKLHIESAQKLAALEGTPINALLSDAVSKQQATARHVLELLFRSIRFLGSKGIPFRGDTTRDGILYEYMLERTYDMPREQEWVARRDNWMSNTIQNEIIQQFAHGIQREIVGRSSESAFFGLVADGTTDISTTEQFSCSLQFADHSLETHCLFLGFYNAPDTTGQTLFDCIKDLFLRMNIPIDRLAAYCFDGASNMSGCFSGVQARLKELCPGSMYIHCNNHALDLVLQEVASEVSLVAETLNFVRSVSAAIRESPKRKHLLETMFSSCDEMAVNILGLCPTRWCVRAKAIHRICASYSTLLATLTELKEDKSTRGDSRAKLSGLWKQARKAKTYFGLMCCNALFEPCEAVARKLQGSKTSALGTLECVNVLKDSIAALRNDDTAVSQILQTTEEQARKLVLTMPENRVSRTPARFRHTAEPEIPAHSTPSVCWKREFYEAVDLVSGELKRRFNEDTLRLAVERERAVTVAAQGGGVQLEGLQLPKSVDSARLDLQMKMLSSVTALHPCNSVRDVAERLRNLHPQTRSLFTEVEKLVQLCLCLPISVASSERSFSTLRRLKTWLRSTMTQQRLTHLALMNV